MVQVKKDITLDDLANMSKNNQLTFFQLEFDFLNQYSPTNFSTAQLESLLDNPHVMIEINQKVFDVIVKLDITVARNSSLERTIQEKGKILNPIFSVFSQDIVQLDGDVYAALYNLKLGGLDILRKTTNSERYATHKRSVNSDSFEKEKAELLNLFGNIPLIILGSSLNKANPSDIDSMVFPNNIDPQFYKFIQGKYNFNRDIPFSFVVTPKEYISSFALSDAHNTFNAHNSIVINGQLEVPIINNEYLTNVRLHNVAIQYYKLRCALTQEGLLSCEKIIPRINNILKIPKFIYINLGIDTTSGVAEPVISQLKSLPPRKELINLLAQANMEAYNILKAYDTPFLP